MKKTILVLTILVLLFISNYSLTAQKLTHTQGEVLVMFDKEVNVVNWAKRFNPFDKIKEKITLDEQLSIPMNIWKLRFNYAKLNEKRVLDLLQEQPEVLAAQFNHFVTQRRRPNDPDYNLLWYFFNNGQSGGTPGVDLGMEETWELTTGGTSAAGDTVVICVIDDGLDPAHRDFDGNLWVNYAEIPDNGIDDDNNGFVDDYNGWNAFRDDDEIDDINTHGTPVTGVIGARGNNNLGTTGIMWEVKLMIVSGGANTEAENIQAFSYALSNRLKYNESAGREGAFVTAINFSQAVLVPDGVDRDFPLWCALLDEMGEAGILTIAAAPNEEVSTDETIEYPARCDSEYLIMVTSVDHNGAYAGRGFGEQTIDIAAFGENIWTTTNGNDYNFTTGTSFATPMVAGAVGLLYTSPCLSLSAIADADPSGAALLVKDYIFDGLVAESSLNGKVKTGGYLNVNNAVSRYLGECSDCVEPTSLAASQVSDAAVTLEWKNNDSLLRVDLRVKRVGTQNWTIFEDVNSGLELESLLACESYEAQLRGFCKSDTLNFGSSFFFQTDGCCEAPQDMTLLLNGENRVLLGWTDLLAARTYTVRYRKIEASEWNTLNIGSESVFIEDLQACTSYEVQVQSNCDTLLTDFSASLFFETLGCGACTDLDYCSVSNASNEGEWIDEVRIAELVNKSGRDDKAYTAFTDLTAPALLVDSIYDITLIPGFSPRAFSEYFRVWVDLNQDGIFTSSEIVFDPGDTVRDTLRGSFSIPASALEGKTRLRVVMNFNVPGGPCTLSGSGNAVPGEVEDYCVNIVSSLEACCAPNELTLDNFTAETLSISWEDQDCGTNGHIIRYRPEGQFEWISDITNLNEITLNDLEQCTAYELQIQGLCRSDFSDFSSIFRFATDCETTGTNEFAQELDLTVFPNPAKNFLTLQFNLPEQRLISLKLFGIDGKMKYRDTKALVNGRQQVEMDISAFSAGVYLLTIESEKNYVVEKVIIE